jgi:hypothetical protein
MHLYFDDFEFWKISQWCVARYTFYSDAFSTAGITNSAILSANFKAPRVILWLCPAYGVCISVYTYIHTTHNSDSVCVCAHAIILVLNMCMLKENISRNKVLQAIVTLPCAATVEYCLTSNSQQCCKLKTLFFFFLYKSHGVSTIRR